MYSATDDGVPASAWTKSTPAVLYCARIGRDRAGQVEEQRDVEAAAAGAGGLSRDAARTPLRNVLLLFLLAPAGGTLTAVAVLETVTLTRE